MTTPALPDMTGVQAKKRNIAMRIEHPIYGPGSIIEPANGCFILVRFDRDIGLPNRYRSYLRKNCLAVSMNVCRRA